MLLNGCIDCRRTNPTIYVKLWRKVYLPTLSYDAQMWTLKGGFPVMAKITRILAANICKQFFFVINTAASTRCLVQNFQLICYSQRENATSQYNDSGSSRCSKWQNDRMVPVVKDCWLLVQGRRGCKER